MSKDIDFAGCTLFVSPRSPFARRVRVAFQENRIPYSERVVDVMNPNPEVIEHNFLSRVPTVVLKTGEALIESNLILERFYAGIESPFAPKTRDGQLKSLLWAGCATGVMEKCVEFYLDALRPEVNQDRELALENRGIFDRFLKAFDQELGGRSSLVEGRTTQVDFDLAIALTYLQFRVPESGLARFSRLVAYRDKLEERESFRKTRPQ